jgi:hypothetical protein
MTGRDTVKESDMKTLCDFDKKEVEKRITEIMKMVDHPKYVCRKCARAANEKGLVCKPVKIQATK